MIAALTRLSTLLDSLSTLLGRSVSWLLPIMVLLTFAIVILRYIFSVGFIAMQETVMYLHAIVFMLGISYGLQQQSHVRVDIIYQHLSDRGRAVVDLLGALIFLFPLSIFFIIVSWEYVFFSWKLSETSNEPGGLPFVYLLKSLMLLMPGLLVIQGVSELIKSLLIILGVRHLETSA